MTFFFDNNISIKIVKAIRLIQEEIDVKHITEDLPGDTTDEKLLEHVGNNEFILITKDKNISKRKHELLAFKKYSVRAFILTGKNSSRWQDIKQIIMAWEEMKRLADKTGCWAYTIRPKGKIERIL